MKTIFSRLSLITRNNKKSQILLIGSVIVIALAVVVGQFFTPKGTITAECVTRAQKKKSDTHVGFELVDLQQKQVWETTNFTTAEFTNFQLPITWRLGWMKNQPRAVSFDQSEFIKSPGCQNSGEYTYKSMFAQEWLQVTRLISFNQKLDDSGLLMSTTLEKYHVVSFRAGKSIYILQSPDGLKYVQISRDATRTVDAATLPSGWTLLPPYPLTKDLTFELSGIVQVIRTDNQDSYQGPIPASLDLESYTSGGN